MAPESRQVVRLWMWVAAWECGVAASRASHRRGVVARQLWLGTLDLLTLPGSLLLLVSGYRLPATAHRLLTRGCGAVLVTTRTATTLKSWGACTACHCAAVISSPRFAAAAPA